MNKLKHLALCATLLIATGIPALAGNTLNSGSPMMKGDKITSKNGKYELVYQTDGNLVLYQTQNRAALWASYSSGLASDRLLLDDGGNLCIYNGTTFVWGARGLFGPGGSYRLEMQDDGNAVVFNAANRKVWASYTSEKQRNNPNPYPIDPLDPNASDRLKQGQTLPMGKMLVSPNKKYFLWFQANGNLSMYRVNGDKKMLLWDSMTGGLRAKKLSVANNGNVWLETSDAITVWGTQGVGTSTAGYELVMQDDGNLVVYDGARKPIWATQTAGR